MGADQIRRSALPPVIAYRRATKLVSRPAESTNKVPLAVLPWSVRVIRAEVATKNSADLARRLPDSELVIYPDAGHGGIFQFHAQFVHKALEFLGR
jgi:hypothetical protein